MFSETYRLFSKGMGIVCKKTRFCSYKTEMYFFDFQNKLMYDQ